jgi:CRP-like cAMP-binding protein
MHVAPIPLPLERRREPPPAGLALVGTPGARTASVPPGGVLAGLGRPLDGVVVVQSGLLAIVASSDGRRGLLGVCAPGDVAGLELLDGARAAVAADREIRALASSRVVLVPPAEVARVASRDPSIALAVGEAGRRWAARLERALTRQLCLGVAGRVLEALREVADATAASGSSFRRLEVALPQETMATMVGATRESVNRAIRALAEAGLVRRDGRRYSVAAEGSWTAEARSS